MQYVRCEACGAKAILAASRCPKCTHPLELRDHHGEFVDLTHCRKCDTWYPTSRGSCKWCGTTPTASRSKPIFIGLAFVVVGLASWWLLKPSGSTAESPVAVNTASALDSIPAVSGVVVLPPPAVDSVVDTVAATAAPPEIDTTVVDRPDIAPPRPAPVTAAAQSPSAASFARTGWASTDTWINLRSESDRTGAIIGTLPPGTRVEAGARFRGWRQVKANGVVGWVDPRHLVDAAPPPR